MLPLGLRNGYGYAVLNQSIVPMDNGDVHENGC